MKGLAHACSLLVYEGYIVLDGYYDYYKGGYIPPYYPPYSGGGGPPPKEKVLEDISATVSAATTQDAFAVFDGATVAEVNS